MTDVVVNYLADEDRIAWKWGPTDDFFGYVEKSKRIFGARFKKSERYWHAPASVETCLQLREVFGDELDLRKSVIEWFKENSAERAVAEEHTAADDAELALLPTVAPRLAATLRPDQRAGVAYVAAGYRGAGLIADKPGLGKTIQAIGGVIEAGREGNILVVCPKISVKSVWFKELQKWTDEKVYMARGTRAKREAAIVDFLNDEPVHGRKWLIITAEMLRVQRKPNDTEVKANAKRRGRIEGFEYPGLFTTMWDTILCDESHRMLGSLTVAKSNLMGEGLVKLPQPSDSRRYAMSGTPFGRGGRVQGMFGTLHWLWPDEFTSFWKWAKAYFEIEESHIGRGRTAMKIVGLRKGLEAERFLKSLGPRILRRTKEEVLKNLPPKQYVEVLCEMEPTQRNQYIQLGDDAEITLPTKAKGNSRKHSLLANGVLAEITRAKQVANGALWFDEAADKVRFNPEQSCKIDALIGKLDARGLLGDGGDMKVIISSRYNQFIEDALLPRLEKEGVEYHLLTGKTSDKAREAAMEAFQSEGGPKVFVLNSKAGGVSITLDAADEVHCLDELDNPEDNEQLEDRAHRASRNHQVTIFYYRTEGTYDVNLAKNVEDKRQAQFEVLDGRRGIQDVRQWIKYDNSEEE